MRRMPLTITAGLLLVQAACGAIAPSQAPGSSTSGSMPAGSSSAPTAGAASPGSGQADCATFPQGSDPQLEARFPTAVDGNAVTNLHSYHLMPLVCALGGEAGVAAVQAALPGADVSRLTEGQGNVIVDQLPVRIFAIRLPGIDGNLLMAIENGEAIALAMGADPATVSHYTVTQATLGGKPTYISSDPSCDGCPAKYSYASGDVLFTIEDAIEERAARVLAALS